MEEFSKLVNSSGLSTAILVAVGAALWWIIRKIVQQVNKLLDTDRGPDGKAKGILIRIAEGHLETMDVLQHNTTAQTGLLNKLAEESYEKKELLVKVVETQQKVLSNESGIIQVINKMEEKLPCIRAKMEGGPDQCEGQSSS